MSNARYIKSAVLPKDYPPIRLPEIALAGRSNAGKSSLLNTLGGGRFAKVSGSPGKTRLLNFFDFRDKYTIVDMPGYGFSKRSGDEQASWHQLIETYIRERESLCGMVLVMDIRREWSEDERMLKSFLNDHGIPMAIVLAKADKVGRNDIAKAVAAMKKKSANAYVFAVSSLEKTGHVALEEFFYKEWVEPMAKGATS